MEKLNISVAQRGWICPVCSGGVAPHADRCPCKKIEEVGLKDPAGDGNTYVVKQG